MAEHDRSAQSTIDAWPAIERLLPGVICSVCGATTADYEEKCSAEWDSPCPGFLAVEGALQHLAAGRMTDGR